MYYITLFLTFILYTNFFTSISAFDLNYQCIDSITNHTSNYDTKPYIYNQFDLIKGSRYSDCIMTCEQRYKFGYICYSDVGLNYDIWYWFTFLSFFAGFIWSIYCTAIIIKSDFINDHDHDKKTFCYFNVNPQSITICVNNIVFLLRLVWLSLIYNGRSPDAIIGGVIVETFLIKLGQILIFTEFFGIILIWRNIVYYSISLKKIDKKDDFINYRKSIFFASALIFIIFPCSIIGDYILPPLAWVANIVLAILSIILIYNGVINAFSIIKLIKFGITDQSKKNAIRSVQIVNYIFCFTAIICNCMIIINYIGLIHNPLLIVWLWWFIIHTSEVIILCCLAYSVSHKARATTRLCHNYNSIYTFNKHIVLPNNKVKIIRSQSAGSELMHRK